MSYTYSDPKNPGKKPQRATPRLVYTSKLPSKTKTSFASEADINVIVARFLKTGLLPSSPVPPTYMDTTQIPRGSDALMTVRNAQRIFEALPIGLRKELDHDPAQLEIWLRDPANADRARQFGLDPSVFNPPKRPPSKEAAPAEQASGANDPKAVEKPVAKQDTKD